MQVDRLMQGGRLLQGMEGGRLLKGGGGGEGSRLLQWVGGGGLMQGQVTAWCYRLMECVCVCDGVCV